LLNARDFMEDEYLNSWDCCTPPRTPVSMEPREHKELIDPYSFDDMVKVADLIRATDAALSDETPDTPQDTRICKVCDGGPGNNGVCTCGVKAWGTEAMKAVTDGFAHGISFMRDGKHVP